MKTNQIILTITLLFTTLLINAQDKYEFVIITYSADDRQLSVSMDGKEFSRERIELPKDKKSENANPLLQKVNEFQDKEWEVMSFTSNTTKSSSSGIDNTLYFAFLRKKKSDKK